MRDPGALEMKLFSLPMHLKDIRTERKGLSDEEIFVYPYDCNDDLFFLR